MQCESGGRERYGIVLSIRWVRFRGVLERRVVVSMLSVFFASTVALYSNERSAVFFYVTAMYVVDRFLTELLRKC